MNTIINNLYLKEKLTCGPTHFFKRMNRESRTANEASKLLMKPELPQSTRHEIVKEREYVPSPSKLVKLKKTRKLLTHFRGNSTQYGIGFHYSQQHERESQAGCRILGTTLHALRAGNLCREYRSRLRGEARLGQQDRTQRHPYRAMARSLRPGLLRVHEWA